MNQKQKRKWGLLGLCLSWGLGLAAQSASVTLDVAGAVKKGLAYSPQLKVALGKEAASTARVQQYWYTQIPTVQVNAGYNRLSDNIEPFTITLPNGNKQVLNPQVLNQYNNRLSASQVVFSGFRGIRFIEASQFLEKASHFDTEKDKHEVAQNIVAAFLNVYKLEVSKGIIDSNVQVARSRRADVQQFIKNGAALENDGLKADLAVAQLEMAQKELENGLSSARFALNTLLGIDPKVVIEIDTTGLTDSPEVAVVSPNVATRPDIVAVDWRLKAAEKQVEVAKGLRYPTVSVGANAYYSNPNPRVFPAEARFQGTWDAGINVSYNLTNIYTSKFQIAEARANLASNQAAAQQLTDVANIELKTAFNNLQTALDKVVLGTSSVKQSIENQRIVKARYQQQAATLTELLEADFLAVQTQLNLENSKVEVRLAYYKWQKAAGKAFWE